MRNLMKKFWCRVSGHGVLSVVQYDLIPQNRIHRCRRCKATGTHEELGYGWLYDNMRGQTDYGKGGATRPRYVSRELRDLNYELAFGLISRSTYNRRRRKLCRN